VLVVHLEKLSYNLFGQKYELVRIEKSAVGIRCSAAHVSIYYGNVARVMTVTRTKTTMFEPDYQRKIRIQH
jgi:hypothetical protein